MTVQQKAGDLALLAVVSVALSGSSGGRSSADDWEGGLPSRNIHMQSAD